MQNDLRAVLGKELIELRTLAVGDRTSGIRFAVALVVVGWLAGRPVVGALPLLQAITLALIAAFVAAAVSADILIGERERGTLDTLLATPARDGAILAGKLIAVTAYAAIVQGLVGVSAIAWSAVLGQGAPSVVVLAAAPLGWLLALGVGLVATLASFGSTTVRAVQQQLTLTIMLVLAAPLLVVQMTRSQLAPTVQSGLSHPTGTLAGLVLVTFALDLYLWRRCASRLPRLRRGD